MTRPASFLQREPWHRGWQLFYGCALLGASPLLSFRDLAGCVAAGLLVDAAIRVRHAQPVADEAGKPAEGKVS